MRKPLIFLMISMPRNWSRLLCLFLAGFILSQPLAAFCSPRDEALVAALDELVGHPFLEGASVAVRVERSDGAVVWDHRGSQRMMPASNLKLATAACALELLSPDFVATTEVLATEACENGDLQGPLFLRGGGDPSLVMTDLDTLARAIADQGIQCIKGGLCGDETLFSGDPYGENWSVQYLERYYAAPVSALSLNKNVVDFWFRPGDSPGDPAMFRTEPPAGVDYLSIRNCSQSMASCEPYAEAENGCSLYLERELWSPRVTLIGRIPMDYEGEFEEAVTVTEPAHFAVSMLKEALVQAGIQVEGSLEVRATPTDAEVLGSHHSEPYRILLQRLLKRSDNHYAELLFRHLSVLHGDGSGAAEDAGRVVREWISRFVLAEPDDLLMADGSGLSRLDLATARMLCDILQYMQRHQDGALFRNALPCAGVDGTLRMRLKEKPACGRVWAKTGYIGQVRTISGYVVQEGEKLAPVFSIMVNHYLVETKDISRLQDAMVQAIAAWASGMDESEIRSAARMSPQ